MLTNNTKRWVKSLLGLSLAGLLCLWITPLPTVAKQSNNGKKIEHTSRDNRGKVNRSKSGSEPAGASFKTGGEDFGKGGEGFGKGLAKGKPGDAGRDLGKGFGAGGKKIGLGVAHVFTR